MNQAVKSRRCRTRRGTKLAGAARFGVEGLERRRLLAAVSWDGGGDGTNWTDPLNWSNNALPGAADDVTISVGANPTVLIPSGTQSIHSLVSDELIRTTGGTLAVSTTASASQSVTLAGGGLSGGAWNFTGGAGVVGSSSSGTLANVAITGGDILLNTSSAVLTVSGTTSFPAARLQNSCTLQMATGYTLNSLVVAEGAAAGSRGINMAAGGSGTVTYGAGAIVRLAAGCGGGLFLQNSSTATLVNNGLITAEAAGRTLTIQNSTFTNNATTQATAGTLAVSATNWSNPGTITAASGTTATFTGAWSDAGTLSINAATLNLGGTFSTSGINFPGFSRTGGTVNLTGTLNNAASTLTLDAGTGTWNFLGGTINNGTVNQTGGSILAMTSSSGTLNSVALTGADLLLDTASATVIVAGTTSFSAARLQSSSTLQLAAGYTLNSLIVAEGAAAGSRTVTLANGGAGTVTIAPAATVRLAAGCGGNLSLQNSSTATLINNGLITAEAAGRTLTIQNSTFTNNATTQVTANTGTLSISATNWSNPGTITASSGTTVNFSSTWSNAGLLSINAATLNLGGTFSTSGFNFPGFTRTGGTVNLTGTLNNAASTLTLNASTGTWNFLGGTINNGTVNQTGGSILAITSTTGTLNSVALTGADLLLDTPSATVTIAGTTSFSAARLQSSATLQLAAGYTLNSLIVAEGAAAGTRTVTMATGGAGTVTIAPAAIVRLATGCGGNLSLQNSSTATLVNNGLITGEATGRLLQIQNSTFTNNATTQTTAGTLGISATNWSNPGTITAASGTIVNFSSTWTNAGTLSINSATLNLGGNFTTSGFNFAGFARTGGTVNLTGTLNNAASTLTLNAGTGTWNLLGGTINNGTVNHTAGSILAITSTLGTLNSVAVTGADLLLDTPSATVTVTGTTSFPAARLQSSATFQMAPGYTLNSLVVAEGAAAGTRTVSLASGGTGTVTVSPTGSIRLAPGCGGNLSVQNSSVATLVNNGSIFGEAAGRSLFIQNSVFSNAGTISASAGTIAITPAFTNSGSLSVGTGAVMTVGGALTNTGQLSTSGRLAIAGLLDIQSGSQAIAQPGGTALIRVTSLSVAANNVLEMNDNDLIVDYATAGPSPLGTLSGSTYTGLLGLIQKGRTENGTWDGPGIRTSMSPADDGLTGLGAAEASDILGLSGGAIAIWEGQTVDATTVIIKYTYVGDANLDGLIDGGDYGVIDNFAQVPGAHDYANGDFNYDGVIDGGDFGLIDNNIQAQGAPL